MQKLELASLPKLSPFLVCADARRVYELVCVARRQFVKAHAEFITNWNEEGFAALSSRPLVAS